MNELTIGNEKLPSIIKDPFKKNCVTSIKVSYGRKLFGNGEWVATGYVYFKNGDTDATQKFEHVSFDTVVLQIREFINSLD